MDYQIFYKRVRILVEKSGKTQHYIANACNASESTFSRVMLGRGIPDVKTVVAIADYFNVSVDWLLGRPQGEKHLSEDASAVAVTYDAMDETDKIIVQAVCAKYN